MARAGVRFFVLCALLAGLAQTVAEVIVLRNTDPAIRFANVSWTSQTSNQSMSPCILRSDDPMATITVALPANAATVQWFSMRPSDAATYLVCIDCNTDSDWQHSVVVDARGSATAPSLIWTSKQLDPNVNHTMVVRNVVDPRFNTWSTVSMDALVVQTGPGTTTDPPPPPTDDDNKSDNSSRYMIPVVVLSTIGGVALLLTILIILYYLRRKRAARSPSAQWHDKYFGQDDKPSRGPYASLRSKHSDAQYRADLATDGLYNSTPWLEPSPRHASQGSAWSQRVRDLPPLPESPRPTQEPPVSSGSASVATAQPPTGALVPISPSSPSSHPGPVIPTPAPSGHSPLPQHLPALPPTTYTDPFDPPIVPLQHQEPLAPIKETSVDDSQPLYDGRETEPPAPMLPTFADAAAHRENSTDSTSAHLPSVVQLPPLPYQLPPTRTPSFASTTVMDIPLPDFEPTPTLPTPGPARTQSNIRPGHRRPAGPRIASNAGLPPAPIRRTITQTTVASIPEESLTDGSTRSPAALTTGSESPLTPGHRPARQESKGLPELPFDQLFADPLTGSTDDSTPLSAFPDVPGANDLHKPKTPSRRGPPIQIPVGGRRPGGANKRKPPPTRKSTASTMASSSSGPVSRAPTLIRWEPDFLEIESTPEGSRMVTVGAEPHRERGRSASFSPQTSPLQDSPLDVGLTDWEDEGLLGQWLAEPPMRQDSGANASSVRSTSGGTVASTMRRMLTGDTSTRYQRLDSP